MGAVNLSNASAARWCHSRGDITEHSRESRAKQAAEAAVDMKGGQSRVYDRQCGQLPIPNLLFGQPVSERPTKAYIGYRQQS
jgi:hypothetical protein